MKILPKAVDEFLRAPRRHCEAALLYGPDAGLVHERAGVIRKAIMGAQPDPLSICELATAKILADRALLADELSAISLMAPERFVIIPDATDKIASVLESCLPYLGPCVFLLVCAEELAPRSALRQLFERETKLAATACYKDEARDIHALIRREFDRNAIRYDRECADYLAAQLGNDRGVTLKELEKIALYCLDTKTLRLEDAMTLCGHNKDISFDDLCNAVAERDPAALDRTLMQLEREHIQPIAYLRALQKYFNRLYALKIQTSAGRSAQEAVAALKPAVFFRQVPLLIRQLSLWSQNDIAAALKMLIGAELSCKSASGTPSLLAGHALMEIALKPASHASKR